MIQIIPAIDLMDGKCVRLTQGDFARRKTYADDPVEAAKAFEDAGLTRLHIVDLDGARSGIPANLDVLGQVAKATGLRIDYGGGIKKDADIERVFDAGAQFANIGSIAVTEPEKFFEWLAVYGSDRILLGADVRDRMLAIHGWQTETDLEIVTFLGQFCSRGANQAFVTDIRKDGALQGPAFELYSEIIAAVPELKLIASGGVSSLDDIDQLEKIGCSGVIVGKAIYEGRVSLTELSEYSCSQNA
ncbi:MAG: 1-(5-phosphoribosyl)-5-[(5-phosphoribosylamino)methylideneamino]imidazole-4-carboxamide isomerase [Pyrinomonadaceae bacterium]